MIFNKELKVILSLVIAVTLLTPFDIHADTISRSNIVGGNIDLISSDMLREDTYSISTGNVTRYFSEYIYEVNIKLDANYVGSINLTFPVQYYAYYTNDWDTGVLTTYNVNRNCFVSGNIITFSFSLNSYTPIITKNPVITINSSNVEPISNSDIIRDFPLESYPWMQLIFDAGYTPTNWNKYLDYYIPTFELVNGDTLFHGWVYQDEYYYMSFFLDRSLIWSNINDCFNFNNFEVTELNTLNVFYGFVQYTLKLKPKSNGNTQIDVLKSIKIMPLYFGYNTDIISTDFAITIGVQNSFLKDISTIANGTTASQSAAVDSQTANSQLETSSNQLFTQEDSFKSDMNKAMQNIPSFSVNNFGSNFMSSATWVRQQYERMTNNTPFQQVITFSLLVGLSMILIGKVRK